MTTSTKPSPGQLIDTSAGTLKGGKALVVVGVDGSAASDQALRFAVHEAQLRDAILRIVTSHDLAAVTYGYAGMFDIGPFEDGLRSAAESLVATAAESVTASTKGSPLQVETVVVQGRASQVLLEAAKGAALLVVGARGAGAFSRLMMGSTSTEVVHHAHVPVAIVPCPERPKA